MDYHYYVLAAGRGRRAGGPKAWQTHAGKTLLQHHVEFLTGRTAATKIAVSIQDEWRPRCLQLHDGIHWASTNPEASPLSSLQRLTEVLPLDRWSFVYHVDMPLWEESVFAQLQAAIPSSQQTATEAIVPTCKGRGGHPILLSAALAHALSQLNPDVDRLDHWLRQRHTLRLEVASSLVLENWNQGTTDAA